VKPLKVIISSLLLLLGITLHFVLGVQNDSYKAYYLLINFDLKNGGILKNVSIFYEQNLTNLNVYTKGVQKVLNDNQTLKYNKWSIMAIMVWKNFNLPTILWQTFPIGQYTSIVARGCKHGHCKTAVRTVGTADYVTVVWSCFNYDFSKSKGEPDLDKCKILMVNHNYPFIYGSGAAVKSNIHVRTISETHFGEVNDFLNSKHAEALAVLDFIKKIQNNLSILNWKINEYLL